MECPFISASGLLGGYIGAILVLYSGNIGIMENKMETSIV